MHRRGIRAHVTRWTVVVAVTLLSATTVAFLAPAAASASTVSISQPDVIPGGGGGGWEFSDTVPGNCGVAAIGANSENGKVTYQVQLLSSFGPITGGEVYVRAFTRTSGIKELNGWVPTAADGDWVSEVESRDFLVGQYVTLTFYGYVFTAEAGYCALENPTVIFKVT
jgi:hypothetical protein